MELDEATVMQLHYLAENARKAIGAEILALVPVMEIDTGRKSAGMVATVSREELGGKGLTVATASLLIGAARETLHACTDSKLTIQIVDSETGIVIPWDGGPLEI